MSLKKTTVLAIISLFTLVSVPAQAQDLLAKQAPVDTRMRIVDTLTLRTTLQREEAQLTVNELYEDWNTENTHNVTELPDSFRINLKHFSMPSVSRVVTSNYGARWGRTHKGIDIKVYTGDTIRSAFSGKVRIVKYERRGYGKYVVIRHQNGLETIYGHMSKWLVEENEVVKAGQPIGLGGNTGRSTGSHLHFETRLCGVALNPALMFDFRNQDVVDDYYMFRKDTYQDESVVANRLRGKIGNGGYVASDVRGETIPGGASVAETDMAADKKPAKQAVVRYHKVAVGETLTSIAKRRKTTINELCRLNRLSRDIKLRPGQLLRYS